MKEEDQQVVDQIRETDDYFKKARLIQFLQKEKHITTKDLSGALDLKPSYLCHITRLNKLPELVIDGYYSKLISVSHLFLIARLKEIQDMTEIYEKALATNLTVLQTEELVREKLFSILPDGSRLSSDDVEAAKEKIKTIFKNVSVKIIQTRVKAKVIIEVKGNLKKTSQTLASILEALSK